MRTLLLSAALYLVIALPVPGSQKIHLAPTPNSALASVAPIEPAPVETTGSIAPPAESKTTPPPEGASALIDSAKIKEVLDQLARPPTGKTKADICDTLAAAALVHDLPVGFFVRLIQQESGFDPGAVSSEEWGLDDPFDPHQALPASARFLRSLYRQFGNWGLAAAAYNGGMGRIQKWIDKRGKLPEETRKYVLTITGHDAEKWASGSLRNVDFTVPSRAPCKDLITTAGADTVPLPRPRGTQMTMQTSAAPTAKRETKYLVASRTVKIVIPVVTTKIAAPAPIMTEARKASPAAASVKVAAAAKTKNPVKLASAEAAKKAPAKGRVQLAMATRPSRK
jgi:hypothetical protein